MTIASKKPATPVSSSVNVADTGHVTVQAVHASTGEPSSGVYAMRSPIGGWSYNLITDRSAVTICLSDAEARAFAHAILEHTPAEDAI